MKMMKKRYLNKRENGTQETPAELYRRIAHGLAEVERTKHGKTPAQAANNMRSLMQEISLETTLRELGITDLRQIQELVLKEVNTERLGNNPRLLAPDDIRAILAKIF